MAPESGLANRRENRSVCSFLGRVVAKKEARIQDQQRQSQDDDCQEVSPMIVRTVTIVLPVILILFSACKDTSSGPGMLLGASDSTMTADHLSVGLARIPQQ